jgi:hypothetical protein
MIAIIMNDGVTIFDAALDALLVCSRALVRTGIATGSIRGKRCSI